MTLYSTDNNKIKKRVIFRVILFLCKFLKKKTTLLEKIKISSKQRVYNAIERINFCHM